MSMAQLKKECYGKNDELLERTFPGRFSTVEKNKMSLEKERAYQEAFRPELALIKGLPDFLNRANEHSIQMAIGSAAIMYNIDFVLDGLDIRSYFNALVSADDVVFSKPHAETYLKCAGLLGVDPKNCIVFEDSPKGVEASANAGMRAVVLTTMHTKEEFNQYDNIICFVENYEDHQLDILFNKMNV